MTQEEQDEKALIKLGESHIKLVDNLKKALLLGQLGFLKAGEILSAIKEKETYKGEDLDHPWTWADFCARPDLPIPGRTKESRRRVADELILVYNVFVKTFAWEKEKLAPIGWTKLALIAPLCSKPGNEEVVEDWIERAKELSLPHLLAEIKSKDEDAYDQIPCNHEDAYQIWYCPKCGYKNPNDIRSPKSKKS